MRRIYGMLVLLVLAGAADAYAQLPLQVSLNGGVAVPVRNEGDTYDNGIHVGLGLKFPLIPVRLEASYDKMPARGATEDLSVLGGGIAVPIGITPPLLPVGLYAIVGGGVYRTDAERTATDFGINGGVGVRAGIPGISLFAEGRAVGVLDEINKRTYVTAAVGIRF